MDIMNPQYFIDIFLKLAFLEDELAKLNLSQDIIDFINSSPNHIKPLLLSKIKKKLSKRFHQSTNPMETRNYI
jgi:hypothetical protein